MLIGLGDVRLAEALNDWAMEHGLLPIRARGARAIQAARLIHFDLAVLQLSAGADRTLVREVRSVSRPPHVLTVTFAADLGPYTEHADILLAQARHCDIRPIIERIRQVLSERDRREGDEHAGKRRLRLV